MSLQPLCVRSMRTGVASRRIGNSGSPAARQQFGADAQRIIGGMADAEHPLVAAHRAHAAAHLVGQGLEAQRRDSRRPARWRWRRSAPSRGLRGQEDVDGLFEAALQQVGVAGEGNRRARVRAEAAAECGSGGWRTGRTARARARRGCRWSGGSGRAPGIPRAVRRAVAPRHSASSDRSRISGSLAVMTPTSRLTARLRARHLPVRQQFEQVARALRRGPGR